VQIRVVVDQPWVAPADVLAIPVIGDPVFDGPLGELDRRSGGELSGLVAFGELPTRRYYRVVAASGELPFKRLVVVSGGKADEFDLETARRLGATTIRRLVNRNARTMAVWLDPVAGALAAAGDADALATAADVVTRGIVEGGFEPKAIYREDTDAAPPALDELILVAASGDGAAIERAAERGRIMGEGANIARGLANRSANDITPQVLADEASALATQYGLAIDVIDERRAAEMGMNLLLAVGQGSASPPRMIVLRSGEAGEHDALDRHVALVGKGVCFDSGGISIKPAAHMEEMKMDKTGACTVIAAITTLARLAPGTPLLAVAPAVENMPSGSATRPGDIVKALNGKWVDILNTDAEGRLILADAMTYAEQLGATHLVDVATLTGAAARAMGQLVTAAFATPDAWWDQVAAAGERAGERYWRIPLVEDYRRNLRSWYGDLANIGTAEGGLVQSGLFLEEFRTVPWAHLDIAGTAYFRETTQYAPRGATGVAHATLVELALAGAAGR
jgi:leucyl aminopeptidase